jgi:hypothetical protein
MQEGTSLALASGEKGIGPGACSTWSFHSLPSKRHLDMTPILS